MAAKRSLAGELLVFLWQKKIFWLLPMIFVIVLLALVLVFASDDGVGPFIYTLF